MARRHLVFFVCTLIAAAGDLRAADPAVDTLDATPYDDMAVFTRALELIRQDYVDEKKTGYRDLLHSALHGMLSALDPHSQFLEPSAFRNMQDDTRGAFGGVGLVVTDRDGTLTVVSPMEGMPGFKAGILPGDRILKINGNSTERMTLSDAIEQLRGEPGVKVTLTILRPATNEIQDHVLERAVIPLETVRDARLLPETQTGGFKIGYVRVTQFSEPTANDLAKALDRLDAAGLEALVLDLRYNPGGLLHSAVNVCAQFLPPDTMVVYTEGRTPSQQRSYRTPAGGKPPRRHPLAILINGGSASGAEIVAGALKDLNRAVLVGETTFGKGSVQTVVQLPDNSALRLTTAHYFTPARQLIHEHGVTPTIRATLDPREERALLAWRRDDRLPGDRPPGPEAELRDTQLARAVDALRGLLIYAKRERKPAVLQARKEGGTTSLR